MFNDIEWLDEDGYPTEEALDKIKKWPYNDVRGLFDFIHDIWYYADSNYWREEFVTKDDYNGMEFDRPRKRYYISTIGWSGNESIIHALKENEIIWCMHWVQSRRGGHYIFEDNQKIRVRYSTNMMGPWHLDWYRQRGLTKKVTKVLEKDSPWSDKKSGDVIEYDEITEHYAGGRIDFHNPYTDSMYSDEMGVPLMRAEDWSSFGNWLDNFETYDILNLEQLVNEYEKTNPPIRWWIEKDEK
jgi:hypothetical protein